MVNDVSVHRFLDTKVDFHKETFHPVEWLVHSQIANTAAGFSMPTMFSIALFDLVEYAEMSEQAEEKSINAIIARYLSWLPLWSVGC